MQVGDYEVFLSYRGPDTRAGFTDFLYTYLVDLGVRTFKDDEDLRISKEFSPELIQAIEQSKISILILSKDYASSVWCLKELTQMVECRKRKGQIILPIFYNVKPSMVRDQTGCYGKAISLHRQRYDDETVRLWTAALRKVTELRGFDLTANSVPREASFAKKIVEYVLSILKRRNFVGIEHHVERVMELLNVESSDVHVVGIHGIGGTGKTTIAKLIYKKIFHLFDSFSFLESVRENAKKPGSLVNLQGQLISDLLGAMHRQIPSVNDGIKSIRSIFFHKKLLIVLDDIEPSLELAEIIESLDWLGSGSRIIITTRDEQALNELGVSLKYKVGGMQPQEALKLFHVHAFREKSAPDDFATLSERIVSTIDRLPLTIEVVGSYLFSKSKEVWTQTLDELENVPELQVQQNLMVIIKALPEKQRQIFLDIACFFIGEYKSVACHLWSDHDSAGELELEVLVLWSIVKIENDKLWMHDQLRDLGRNILQREYSETGKRSRLWIHEEALDVLMKEKVRSKFIMYLFITAFTFDFAEELGSLISLEEILIDGTAVQEIPASIGHLQNLGRFSAYNCLSLIQLPESIGHVESLRVLALNGTKIAKLPLSRELQVLQHLSINHCWSILKLPTSLGTLASMTKLDLSSTAIVELPDDVSKLNLLTVLKIDFTFVRKLPSTIWTLKRLEELHASRCRSLDGEIPRDIEMLSALKVLRLGYSQICGLPDSISRLPNLQTLDLLHCDQLREVPKLPPSLISLFVSSKLMHKIPDIGNLVKLGELFLADGSQEPVLPIESQIELKRCTDLQLWSLLELKILQLSVLKIQPVGLHYLIKLRKLSLCCIHLEELPQLPPGLSTLSLHHYKLWTGLPNLSHLEFLSEFELFNCAVKEVAGLGEFKSLRVFRISHCNLQRLDELENSIFLASLNVSYCRSLEKLPNLSNLKMLKDIKIKDCPKIPDIRSVEHLKSLEKLSSSTTEAESSSEVTNSADFPTRLHRWSMALDKHVSCLEFL
ncbi:TMV resistance protein N-like [Eucalyptus grandis]|uniref:TMV resistance protein N-like n=1 Tax=Eucalyptus grandis TaxID=71139 RepID=UPI00192ECEF7|nr:TMV resistance protein N-like [Eucalyptus grandis]